MANIKISDRIILPYISEPSSPTDGITLYSLSNGTLNYKLPSGTNKTILNSGSTGTTTQVLHGNESGVPTFSSIVENDISLSDVTTLNASTLRHGLLPKLTGTSTDFLNGEGNFISVTAITALPGYLSQTFTNQTSVTITHNFGAYPCVQVLDSSDIQINPESITHNSNNQFTVVFSISTTGRIIASVGSSQVSNVTTTSTDYNALLTDDIIIVTAINKTVTLPNITASYTGISFSSTGGEVTITQNNHNFVNGSVIVVTNSSNTTNLPNNSYVIYSVTQNTFKVFGGSGVGTGTLDASISIATGKTFSIDNNSTGYVYVTGSQKIQNETIQTIPQQSCILVYNTGSVWRIR